MKLGRLLKIIFLKKGKSNSLIIKSAIEYVMLYLETLNIIKFINSNFDNKSSLVKYKFLSFNSLLFSTIKFFTMFDNSSIEYCSKILVTI